MTDLDKPIQKRTNTSCHQDSIRYPNKIGLLQKKWKEFWFWFPSYHEKKASLRFLKNPPFEQELHGSIPECFLLAKKIKAISEMKPEGLWVFLEGFAFDL